jgi:hypothetical protein
MAVRKIDNFDEFINEYVRVRVWLVEALKHTTEFTEQQILIGLILRQFVLWTSDNAACVAQITAPDCLLVLVGGSKGKALREIMIDGQDAIIAWAGSSDCTRIVGSPRMDWSRLLLKSGFKVDNKNTFHKDF